MATSKQPPGIEDQLAWAWFKLVNAEPGEIQPYKEVELAVKIAAVRVSHSRASDGKSGGKDMAELNKILDADD